MRRVTREPTRFLSFTLNGEEYAVPLLKIQEVIAFREITPIRPSPSYCKGVMRVGEEVVPVIDLRLKLRMPQAATTFETAILILDLGTATFGAIVDTVESVFGVARECIEPRPEDLGLKADCVTKVIRRGERFMPMLEPEDALSVEDVEVLKAQATQDEAA